MHNASLPSPNADSHESLLAKRHM
jgi:hypothetical protein